MIGITQLNFLEKGFHRAKVTTPGSLTFAEFCATAVASAPANIAIVMTPSNQSTAGQPMAQPLAAIITDDGGNSVDNVPVTFQIQAGGGSFQGGDSVVVSTNPDGIAEASWTLGPNTGIANNEATATFDGNPVFPATFIVSGVIPGAVEDTSVSGIVQDSTGGPIVGAKAVIRGTNLEAFTGPDGKFTITNVQPGGHHVRIIGSTGNDEVNGVFFPDIDFAIEAISGVDNTLDQIVILPFLDMDNAQLVGGDEDVVLTMAGVEGFAIKVFANSTFVRDPDTGDLVQTPQLMSSSQVKFNKVPMPPPQGSTPLIVGTLQPAGVTFDPPAQVTYPNAEGLAPGDVADIFAFHHDIGQFVNIGPGTVSENGSVVISDPGFGIVQSGWHCLIRVPGPVSQCANECTASWSWSITRNGSGSGFNTPVVMCASNNPLLQQEALVTVTFGPGGGSNDPSPVWGGADFVGTPTNGNSVTIRASAPGEFLLTSPIYRIPLPPELGGDKTCQVEIPVISHLVEVIQIEGLNKDGAAIITARVTPSTAISSAKLKLNGSVHSQITSPFTGGTFTLPLDQNDLDFILSNTLKVEVDIGGAICKSSDVTAQPISKSSTTTKTANLVFYGVQGIIGGGLGLLPAPFPLDFKANSIEYTWSIPETGLTSAVPALYPNADSELLKIDTTVFQNIDPFTNSVNYNNTLTRWDPNGPSGVLMTGMLRFSQFALPNRRFVAAETGTNWWFKEGGSGSSEAELHFTVNGVEYSIWLEPNFSKREVIKVFLP